MKRLFQRQSGPDKARRAAEHPDRPGDACKAEPGTWAPEVNRHRCEGKGDCVEVCPYNVFEVARIGPDEYRAQPLRTRIKLRVHGMRTAFTPNAEACKACGLCVVACPENAISLNPVRR